MSNTDLPTYLNHIRNNQGRLAAMLDYAAGDPAARIRRQQLVDEFEIVRGMIKLAQEGAGEEPTHD